MLDSKPQDQFLTTARNQSTNSIVKVFRTEPLHGSPLRHPKSSRRPGWRSGCNQVGTHIASVQNAIFWLRNISFCFFDYVIEFQVKSLIFNTFKCCRHTQHFRVITPWSHFAQYQPQVRCEALTSWSLSLSLAPPLLGRSLAPLVWLFFHCSRGYSSVSLLHFPILALELSLLWGDASLLFFRVCKNHRANSMVKSTLGDKDPMASTCLTTEPHHQSLQVTIIVWQLRQNFCAHEARQASKFRRCCPLYPVQQIT